MDVNEDSEAAERAEGEGDHEDVDIDPDKIRGDAIGDTIYSERYVLKVLIQLSQYEDEQWSDEFESDLCVLWDMTASPAVVHFLMRHDCLNLIATTLQATSNARLMEILVGILGNMCCVAEVRPVFSMDQRLCDMLLQLLACPDAQTIIQLTRCFNSFTWDLLKADATLNTDQHWFEKQIVSGKLASQLAFILSSSLCEELLMAVADLLNTLCGLEINDKDYSRYFATTEMIDGMMESWNQLFLCCKEGSKFEFTNKQLEKAALHWVAVLLAFAGQESGRDLLGVKAKRIVGAVMHWVQAPQDSGDSLLVTSIALLEALVSHYFSPEALCKAIHVVRKTTERRSEWESDGGEQGEDMTVLSLRESFGNYCLEVLKCVDRRTLDSVLVKNCNDKSIQFFWRIIEEREPDLGLSNDRSR